MAEAAAAAADAPAPSPSTERLLVRLRRAEGQIRGVQRMIAEDAPCEDILTQMAAVKAAVDQVGLQLIGERLRTCAQSGAEGCGEDLEEALATLLRFGGLAR